MLKKKKKNLNWPDTTPRFVSLKDVCFSGGGGGGGHSNVKGVSGSSKNSRN